MHQFFAGAIVIALCVLFIVVWFIIHPATPLITLPMVGDVLYHYYTRVD